MNPLGSVQQAKKIAKEIKSVLTSFDVSRNNSLIITSKGRAYQVANVLESEFDGSWMVTHVFSQGGFACHICGYSIPSKFLHGDRWTQFYHGNDVVRLHSSMIHTFKKHPKNVPQEILAAAAKVFLAKY
jgi:hypothetical protein